MPKIDPRLACHKLFIYKYACPISQRKTRLGVDKLLKVKFIQEVHYTTWLVNVVL